MRYIWDTQRRKFVPPHEIVAPHVERSDLPMPQIMASFDSYRAPVTDDGGTHYQVGNRKDQARLMNDHDAIDAREVTPDMHNENVRKARGYEN